MKLGEKFMDVLTIEYEIVYFKSKDISVLVPVRLLEGKCNDEKIVSGDAELLHIMDAYTLGKNRGYIEYLEFDLIKKQFKENNLEFDDEAYNMLKEKYNNEAHEKVYYIENGELFYLSNEEFTNKYNLVVDYENSCIKELEKDYTHTELVDIVSKSILFQKTQIKRIVSTIINNYHFTNKKKIILNGKTGTGKTQMVDLIASTLDCPYVKINGYSGESLVSAYLNIYMQSKEKTGPAIIFIDDINRGYDELGILDGDLLIKIMKDLICRTTKMLLQLSDTKTVIFDPANINFILALDLEKHVFDKRMLGINPEVKDNKALEKLKIELIDSNFDILDMNNLTEDNLLNILKKSKISPINEYRNILDSQKTKFVVSKKAYELIAHKAYSLEKGAKGLRIVTDAVVSDLVADAQYRCPKQLVLTEQKVLNKLNNIKW